MPPSIWRLSNAQNETSVRCRITNRPSKRHWDKWCAYSIRQERQDMHKDTCSLARLNSQWEWGKETQKYWSICYAIVSCSLSMTLIFMYINPYIWTGRKSGAWLWFEVRWNENNGRKTAKCNGVNKIRDLEIYGVLSKHFF